MAEISIKKSYSFTNFCDNRCFPSILIAEIKYTPDAKLETDIFEFSSLVFCNSPKILMMLIS
jgi:hypothetical protein